jgi:murein DD-endopeptidase MepM/ murein hydrolase activator NlpD
MKRTRKGRALPLVALLAAFCAGVFVDALLRTYGPPQPVDAPTTIGPVSPAQNGDVRLPPSRRDSGRPSTPDATKSNEPTATTGTSQLRFPIDGMTVESFKGGFAERRGKRPHEAVDILAPRDTPVHAVAAGTIARLFVSRQGGNTIYQFDSAGALCYYYAHLERYADGLHEGDAVLQGQVIGYVGTSGNAPPNTPHLHFAVFELGDDKRWWKGKAIDPYLVFTGRS